MCNLINNHRRPDIYFRLNGRIDITARVSTLLSLSPGDSINIWSEDGEYYLYVSQRNVNDNSYAICRKVNNKSKFLRAWCKPLTSSMSNITGQRESHLLVGTPVTLPKQGIALPLITRNNLYQP